MDWLHKEIAANWRREGKRYAADVNEFVRIGIGSEWKQKQEEPEQDQRSSLAQSIVNMIRAANKAGEVERLREEIPPASWPITPAYENKTHAVKPIAFLQDGSFIVHTGGHGDIRKLYLIYQQTISEIPNLQQIGCSPDGNYFALVNKQGIRIMRGLNRYKIEGESETAVFSWEYIQNSIKKSVPEVESLANLEHPETVLDEVIPFHDGKSLLLVSHYGIYLIENDEVQILHPELSQLIEDEIEDTTIDMAHGAVSPDGRWIAYGSQCSEHLLKDLSDGTVYEFAPESSYPHYALFSRDSGDVWYNACHFYNGMTIRVPITEAMKQAPTAETMECPLMNDEMRVYAGAALKKSHILGDAYGYLRCMDRDGQEVWRYFVGSTISGITVSHDEERLAVGTYGGMLHFIDLTTGCKSEYSIGTAAIVETERWILWRNEEPLRW
ncbi:hypothetical protein NQ117_01440 [Paenibacillus sp. SC116]|uniref:hypothetical protein n=1 Tax=Paenibacillus sp. SC116 TaxID=2968986 RepID=UPI00215B4075|nr:hypothetical protein [Paenibacillus sp. SC116]MCR8842338.1 hypothetical protein [Paenibacillus sp. SC116]